MNTSSTNPTANLDEAARAAEHVRLREQVAWLLEATRGTVEKAMQADDNDDVEIERYATMAGSLCGVITEKTERWSTVRSQLRERTTPSQRRLCAHAHADGDGMHCLEPGETCERSS